MLSRRIGLALVLVTIATAACKKSAPSDVLPGDPQVTVLDPGATPRALLRYRLTPGAQPDATIDVKMDMKMSMGDRAMPAMNLPVTRMVMAMEIASVGADGVAAVTARVKTADVLAGPGDPPELVANLKQVLTGLVGTKTEMKITPRGFARDVKIEVPKNASPQVGNMLESLRGSIEQLAATFPAEEVGVGGRWRVFTKVETGPMKLEQTAIYTLEVHNGDVVSLKTDLAQSAKPQPLKAPGMPEGTSASLERHEGKGTGKGEVPLTNLSSRWEITLKSTSDSTLIQGESRTKMSMAMEMTTKMGSTRAAP